MTQYDWITNDSGDNITYKNNTPYSDIYPASNVISVTGPMWLPKVYGKDLTAFEIASSGKIALTINDVHSLDVYNRNDGGGDITGINTRGAYAFELSTSNKEIKVHMDSYNKKLNMEAKNTIDMKALDNDLLQTIGRDWTNTTASNVSLTSTSGNFNIKVNEENMKLEFNKLNSNVSLYSSSNITVQSGQKYTTTVGHDYLVTSHSNINLTSSYGSARLESRQNRAYLDMNLIGETAIYSTCNMNLESLSNMNETATYSINMTATNSNLTMKAANNDMYINMLADDRVLQMRTLSNMDVSVSNDYTLNTRSNMTLTSKDGGFFVTTHNSNANLSLDSDSNANLFAWKNIIATSCNNIVVTASNSMEIVTREQGFSLSAHNGGMTLIMDPVANDVTMTGHDLDETWTGDMTTTAVNKSTTLTGTSTLLAAEAVSLTSTNSSINMSAKTGKMTIDFDSLSESIKTYVIQDYQVAASNNVIVDAKNDMLLTASNGDFEIHVNNDGMYLTVDHIDNSTAFYTQSNYNMTVSNHFTATVDSNINLTSTHGSIWLNSISSNVYLSLENPTSNLVLSACNDLNGFFGRHTNLISKCNINIDSTDGEFQLSAFSNIWFQANGDATYIRMNAPSDSIDIYGRTDIDLVTSNLDMTMCNNWTVKTDKIIDFTSSNFNVTACNISLSGKGVNIAASENISYNADSSYQFLLAQSTSPLIPVLTIGKTAIDIKGDLNISGSINTTNIVNQSVIQTDLRVNDKTVILASAGENAQDGNPIDGVNTNDKSGIVIDGLPSGYETSEIDLYKKSFLWNHSVDGVPGLSNSAYDEAYWELQGGSFRLTRQHNYGDATNANIKPISFTMKINDKEELEFYKIFYDPVTLGNRTVCVARFGRFLTGASP